MTMIIDTYVHNIVYFSVRRANDGKAEVAKTNDGN